MKKITKVIENFTITEYIPYNIYIISNVLTESECSDFIQFINSLEQFKIQSPISSGNNVECYRLFMDNLKTHNDIKNTSLKKTVMEYDHRIFLIVNKLLKVLKGNNNYLVCEGDSGYELRKIYGKTQVHIDGIKTTPTNFARTMSIIIALNDDYEGGVYNFPYHEINDIKLKKGEVIAFPPYWTHPHEVSLIENEKFRYTINTWVLEKIY